jgi:hypothetical protein
MPLYSPLSTAIAWHFAADFHFRAVCQSISLRTLCSNQAESSPFTRWVGFNPHLPEMEQWTDKFLSPAPPYAFLVPLLVWGWWQRIRNRHIVLIVLVLHFASL